MAEITLEEQLSKLEEIVQNLEKGSLSLDESLKLYKEGMELSSQCQDYIAKAKTTITKINKQHEDNTSE